MMTSFKKLFLPAIKDKALAALYGLTFAQSAILTILVLFYTRRGLMIPTHCDLGGGAPVCSHSDAPWYYLLSFAAFGLVAFVLGVFVSAKLLAVKGRSLAIYWMWLMVAVLAVATALITAILRIVEL
jgi:hypothetical protein